MARTSDPHEAALKAWRTRARAAGHAMTTQARGDYAARGIHMASTAAISALLKRQKNLSGRDREDETLTMNVLQASLDQIQIPDGAIDGLHAIHAQPEATIMEKHRERVDIMILGEYNEDGRDVNLNATVHANVPEAAELVATNLAHEIGHHALKAKLTDEAVVEWFNISNNGKACRISKYGRMDMLEHFSEAFAAYSVNPQPGEWAIEPALSRNNLKKREPKAYAFMERLFRDRSMWKRKGNLRDPDDDPPFA